MTMVDGGSPADAAAPHDPSWHMVEDGFWVGSTHGTFLGTIERHRAGRFSARSATRSFLGDYRTLAAAEAAVAGHFG